ncbi:MAG: DUF2167 domain-containing protein [Ferruginibacter sp.]|jgi:uncharacterized membrane-anchored protein
MKKITLIIICTFLCASGTFAKDGEDSTMKEMLRQQKLMDSVESALKWETNAVTIANGVAKIKLSNGFKFLNAEQSKYVLHDLWGNPPKPNVLGMIFPANGGPYADSSFAFIVTYEEEGFVKDDDADKINYDEMLTGMKNGEADENKERIKSGYEPIYTIGWAAKPYYDKNNKVLHWAKEFKFGTADYNTLNYEVRVLGRKGILSLNAVATMAELPLVKANIDQVLKMPEFTEGNKYSDFNSSTDKVAEYGIGALVAGGILAKTGAFAVIGKFLIAAWKFIAIGAVAAFGAVKRFITGRRKEEEAV